MTPRNPCRGAGLALFVGFACFYLLFTGGHIYTPDGVIMFRVTRSLVDRGATDILPLETWREFGGTAVEDPATGESRFYAKYGLGLSLAAVPPLIAGRLLARLARPAERAIFAAPPGLLEIPGREESFPRLIPHRHLWYDAGPGNFDEAFDAFAASWTNAFVTAAALAALFALLSELGYSARVALAVAATAGLATPLWHYAQTHFSEPLAGLGAILFLLCGERAARRDSTGWFAAAGFALGICALAKAIGVVLVLPALFFLWARTRRLPGRRRRLGLAAFAAGLAPAVAGIAWYNFARFGSVWLSGYGDELSRWSTPLLEGLAGLTVSPGRGLLLYCPLVVLSLAAWPTLARRHLQVAVFALAVPVLLLLVHARWYMWEGGWCWGPRFLVPALPLLAIPLAELYRRLASVRPAIRAVVAVVLALSALAAVNGLLVNYIDFSGAVSLHHQAHAESFAAAGDGDSYDLLRWRWRFSPLVAYWSYPLKGYLLLPSALRAPGVVLGFYLLCACGVALALGPLARCWRAGRGAPGPA